jgi:molybdopterin-biosynthesis enzyme MoeA-like protein
VPLVASGVAGELVRARFARMGRPMSPSNAKQALVPRGAQVLENPAGTAPGFALSLGAARAFFFPGVPRELRAMVERHLVPWLAAGGAAPLLRRRFHVCGLGESLLQDRLADLALPLPPAAPVTLSTASMRGKLLPTARIHCFLSTLAHQHRAKTSTAQQMNVQVIDFLSPVAVAIHQQAIAALGDPFLGGDSARHDKHVADQLLVLWHHIVGGGDELVRHDQDVHWRLRVDVAKGCHLVVLVDDVGRKLTANDLAEDSFGGHSSSLGGWIDICRITHSATFLEAESFQEGDTPESA